MTQLNVFRTLVEVVGRMKKVKVKNELKRVVWMSSFAADLVPLPKNQYRAIKTALMPSGRSVYPSKWW